MSFKVVKYVTLYWLGDSHFVLVSKFNTIKKVFHDQWCVVVYPQIQNRNDHQHLYIFYECYTTPQARNAFL